MLRSIWGCDMDIRVYDQSLTPLGLIDEINSLVWTIRYFNVGEFSLLVPLTPNNKRLLTTGNIIIKHDGSGFDYIDTHNNKNYRRAMLIESISYSLEDTGGQTIEARGRTLSCFFDWRVIYPKNPMNATIQNIVNSLVLTNAGASAIAKRRFPDWVVIYQDDFGGTAVDYYDADYKILGEEIRDLCQEGKLGYDVLVDEETLKYGYFLYKGKDLTSGNSDGNAPCIFSQEFDNILSQVYEDDIIDYRNAIFVSGAENSSGRIPTVEVTGNETGLARRETNLDDSGVQHTTDDGTAISDAAYLNILRADGRTELATRIEVLTFDSEINLNSNITYKTDFNLGDRVTCLSREWGVTIDSRITEVTQTYEAGIRSLEVTFGESAPTLLDRIKKVRK